APVNLRRVRLRRGREDAGKFSQVLLITTLCVGSVQVSAETIDVSDNHGGRVVEYHQRWAELAARGVNVGIVGPCQSACTVLIGHVSGDKICVTPRASVGFHLGRTMTATGILWTTYLADIRAWIDQHGGLARQFIW